MRIVETTSPGGKSRTKWVTDSEPAEISASLANPVEPLADPAFFLNMAYVPATEADTVSFLSEVGHLSSTQEEIEMPDSGVLAIGESLDTVISEIKVLKDNVAIWIALRNENPEAIRHLMGDSDAFSAPTTNLQRKSPVASAQQRDLIAPAFYKLSDAINTHTQTRFTWKLEVDEKGRGLRLVFIPDSLLTGVWMQFAIAIKENRYFQQCRQCATWFGLEPGTNRRSRQFCSDACRFKSYRDRQDEAYRLYCREELSFSEIAQRLDSDPMTIEKWIELGTKKTMP